MYYICVTCNLDRATGAILSYVYTSVWCTVLPLVSHSNLGELQFYHWSVILTWVSYSSIIGQSF